ncbi:carbon-monoxide dehydrogenase medium subunit [Williamsia limnetica]|uniref:Carbon-monoxide dehydrogenase medium subunit n=1 Tax=Williamsia limnetica TaxID=882452 RepID=A0A318RGK7_WILLI|nr:xanthine dehydrogenase family protein subunit M [Williamsia limnetica]PYE15951.1 carbon-monoxide dehydrogenase medium subunit [Williamsia limnetica]
MKPAAFDYHSPATVDEAVKLLVELGDDAKIIAGGQSLMPMLNLRLAAFDHLVDLRRIDALRGIEVREDTVWIGAGTTHSEIGRSTDIRTHVRLLNEATPLIGHFPIRNRGTIGGSIAHADAAAEYPAVTLALDAEFETVSPRGVRRIKAADFFKGLWSTELAEDELLTGIIVPITRGRCGYAIEEFARRSGDFAIAGAVVFVRLDADSKIEHCGMALFGLGSSVIRVASVEQSVIGMIVDEVNPETIGTDALSSLSSVPADLHGSADYRKRVGSLMVARAWCRAVEEARND